ncbi:MAG: urease accessory protein UreD, partial [Gammaproteobacteria bacterium]|nr:urease accessory protein UreD [Gammaproteobacteria bacterium]
VQRPFYPEGALCHCYLLHPPGGVVGGDRLEIDVRVAAGAAALITSPGATKFYASAGEQARQEQLLRVAAGASLEWLPQENIFFPAALARVQTRVELEPGARFIGWDCQCLGRPVIGERFSVGQLDLGWQIHRGGRPLLLERLRIDPERLDGAAGLRGEPVTATLLATPAGQAELEQVRALVEVGASVGVTLLDDLLVLRYLGDSTEQCRRLFVQAWARLRPSVIGHEPCPPRIWAT